jgi:hypothetical protein
LQLTKSTAYANLRIPLAAIASFNTVYHCTKARQKIARNFFNFLPIQSDLRLMHGVPVYVLIEEMGRGFLCRHFELQYYLFDVQYFTMFLRKIGQPADINGKQLSRGKRTKSMVNFIMKISNAIDKNSG